jgi:tripartite-type tricarboxylate transporter receptor subunit TctC
MAEGPLRLGIVSRHLTSVFAAVTKFAQTIGHLLRTMAASTALIVLLSVSQSHADWPERPITIIVPFPRGGATDLLGRLLAARLTMRLGEPITVVNSVGEVGNVGLRAAAAATLANEQTSKFLNRRLR